MRLFSQLVLYLVSNTGDSYIPANLDPPAFNFNLSILIIICFFRCDQEKTSTQLDCSFLHIFYSISFITIPSIIHFIFYRFYFLFCLVLNTFIISCTYRIMRSREIYFYILCTVINPSKSVYLI